MFSRMQDYYDLYYFLIHFEVDKNTLAEAMKKTFENRNRHFTMEQFELVMNFSIDEAMQKKWKSFCRKIDKTIDDYDTVLKTIKTFLLEPYKVVMGK